MIAHPSYQVRWIMLIVPFLLTAIVALQIAASTQVRVEMVFAKSVASEPFTGRVFLVVSKAAIKDGDPPPRLGWFNPYPLFAQDVRDWTPDTPLVFTPSVGHPHGWGKLPADKYYIQAVLDRDLGGINYHASPGNGYSKPILIDAKALPKEPIRLVIDRVITEKKFDEKPRVKLVDIESKLLTQFHGKPIRLRAGIVLPKSHATDAAKRYPTIYEIPGFGGVHTGSFGAETRNATDVAGVEMLYVVLDPSCRLGHHVFADSDNNGPYGKAFTEELIPHIEATFRGLAEPNARFVTGHSSGGWSSLWLQVTYPDFFGGVWSTAPDPVDFRDFQRVNIYDPKQNLFVDEKGEPRPLARKGKQVTLRYKPFNDMEVVMGRGGQLFSFEAVFSPKGKDGKPMPLWDRQTGVIDPVVAKAWDRYDIRLILERDWPRLEPKLKGKLHVYMGDMDTFYLEGATRLLQQSMKNLKSDAKIELFPNRDHGNLIDAALRQRISREMAERFKSTRMK